MDEPVVSEDSPKNDDGTGEVDDLNSVPTKTMEKGNLIKYSYIWSSGGPAAFWMIILDMKTF